MKKISTFSLIVIFLLITGSAYALESTNKNISVIISDILNHKGNILIGLYNSPEKFSNIDESYKNVSVDIESNTIKYTFQNIPTGTYAISVIHDENDNKTLDKSFLGIPKEGYGFSNNIRPKFRGANFEESKFEVVDDLTITINLGY